MGRLTTQWADDEIKKHRQAIADLEAWKRVQEDHTTTRGELGTKKGLMLKAIGDSHSGLSTQEIIAVCNSAGITDNNVKNYSPQLSILKKEGMLTHQNGIWNITATGRLLLERRYSK